MRHYYSAFLYLVCAFVLHPEPAAAAARTVATVVRSVPAPAEATRASTGAPGPRPRIVRTESPTAVALATPRRHARTHGRGQVGGASFYHSIFDGRKTASGAIFDSGLLTAAHRTLQFGTRVRVTNLVNLKSVIVTINDRGPYVNGRIIDLSHRAAAAPGCIQNGIARVRVEPLSRSAMTSPASTPQPEAEARL